MMGVDRTEYLIWGAQVNPEEVVARFNELEREIYGLDGARFRLIYDEMNGKYAFAGAVIVESNGDALFHRILARDAAWRPEVVAQVRSVFPHSGAFDLIMFTHYH